MFYVTIKSEGFERLIGTEKGHNIMVKMQDTQIYICI